MKKFLVLLLLCAFAPSAFAQFSWNLIADFNTGLMSWNIPAGERAKKFITVDDEILPNVPDFNPTDERGDYTYKRGSLDFFTYGRGDWLRSNELRLVLDYQGTGVDFHLRALLDELVRAELVRNPDGQNNTTGSHSLVMNNGRTPNLNDFLRYSFDEWYVRGNAGFLSAYVGNTPNRGTVEDFNNFTDDVLRNVIIENYGVNTPAVDAGFSANGRDANNFMTRPSMYPGAEDASDWVMPYFMLGLQLDKTGFPLTLQLAADPGQNTGVDTGDNYLRFNGSVRLSAEKIADSITFDAIYRFRGGDNDRLDNFDEEYGSTGTLQPNGTGLSAHVFGLYANIHNVPELGIGLGYSGYLVAYQDETDPETKKTTAASGPLYSGIDLRLQYTGINNITLTSVNNISFAASGPGTDSMVSYGVFGTENNLYTVQGWFALYNALGFDYRMNDRLTASVQIANRYGILTTREKIAGAGTVTLERSRMHLGGGGYAAFRLNRYFLVQGGIAFQYVNNSYTNSSSSAQTGFNTRNASGGAFDIAIPIRASFVYGNR